jgi:hypothetical protein
VIRGHIIENGIEISLFDEEGFNVRLFIRPVSNGRIELAVFSWDEALEIHKIFSESACFIEAAETDNSSSNHLTLLYAENHLIFQFADRIDNTKSHTDW